MPKDNPNSECIFCKIASGEIKTDKVLETDNFIVFDDAKPRTKGHCMVVPKQHYQNLLDMPSSLYGEFLELAKEAAFRAIKNKAAGFNLIMNNFKPAGQVVMHAHLHIVPRYPDDKFRVSV